MVDKPFTRLVAKSDGPIVRKYEGADGPVYVGAADAVSVWFDEDQEDPQVVVATHRAGGGYFMAYTKASDLEAVAALLIESAQLLRATPRPEPEVAG